MPKPAKRSKLKAGEITYESLFAQEMKSDQPNDTNKSDLSQCTKTDCKILDIIAVSGQNNRQTMPITQPILAPLWHEPSNDDTTEKTMYYVRGTDVDLNKLDETGLAGGSDTEPQIVYKVVPNTHAHVIRYVMAEDDEPINENEILELVDISKDRKSVVRCKTGDSISSANIKTEKPEQNKSTSPPKENTNLKDKCRVLELKCKWSDQKMAEMQAEMKKLKQEMMEIRQSQNPAPVLVQKQGQKKVAEQLKIIENRQIKEEAAWEEDDAEYLDVMMLDEEFVDDEDDDSHNDY
ncbi:hypothetical protein HA402_009786 [Bradysia odoriphaga]|nr:hypothetical protein HA402_009786 [Bradysia odoriphaga]